MSLIRSEYANPEDVLRDAPGPSPWYLRVCPPNVSNETGPFLWIDAGDGKTLLKNSSDECLAIFDYYCYLRGMANNRLLVWHSEREKGSRRGDQARNIKFHIVALDDLRPIEDLPKALVRIGEEGSDIFHVGGEITAFRLPTYLDDGKHPLEFPEEFNEFEELLVLGHSPYKKDEKMHLCLFILKPKEQIFEVFPQDWFNNGELDYGYQWVTRVARDPKSGKIYGEGFRISRFVLDDSLRKKEKSFYDDPFYGNFS